ncbi:MAG: response regulator transcription factor [Cyclobacteriaceae bacterium]
MNQLKKIKIALVDDHCLIRDAMAIMLQQVHDIEVVCAVPSGEELLNTFQTFNPDVILMDIIMKGMTGIETTKWLKDRNHQVKIILLSSEIKKEFVSVGIQVGIDGYLTKDVGKEILLEAIRAVHKGEKYFNEAITSLVFEDFYRKEKSGDMRQKHLYLKALTKRELEVLSVIANGKSNKEVAEELFISIKTVETHKGHILDKLGLKNVAQLVKYAIKNNLIADI